MTPSSVAPAPRTNTPYKVMFIDEACLLRAPLLYVVPLLPDCLQLYLGMVARLEVGRGPNFAKLVNREGRAAIAAAAESTPCVPTVPRKTNHGQLSVVLSFYAVRPAPSPVNHKLSALQLFDV